MKRAAMMERNAASADVTDNDTNSRKPTARITPNERIRTFTQPQTPVGASACACQMLSSASSSAANTVVAPTIKLTILMAAAAMPSDSCDCFIASSSTSAVGCPNSCVKVSLSCP